MGKNQSWFGSSWGIHCVYFWGWSAPIQVTLCPIDSLISSILGYRAPVQLYNIVTIATRWKSFRIRTSFIWDLDPLEGIGELWPLSGEDWLLLQPTRIGYKDLSSGDYDPRRGLGEYSPLSGEDWLLLQLTKIGYKDLSSGDYDPRRGLGEYGPISGEDWPLLQP